ncbi:hypothetical protein L1887_58575 [Cichorium endivia]|nr:hypothetical protein L1887_58575 [Cichorium endivia]
MSVGRAREGGFNAKVWKVWTRESDASRLVGQLVRLSHAGSAAGSGIRRRRSRRRRGQAGVTQSALLECVGRRQGARGRRRAGRSARIVGKVIEHVLTSDRGSRVHEAVGTLACAQRVLYACLGGGGSDRRVGRRVGHHGDVVRGDYVRIALGSVDLTLGQEDLELAQPSVAALRLEAALLPVRLVSDARRQKHAALLEEVDHVDVEAGQEVTLLALEPVHHLGAEGLDLCKRRAVRDLKLERLLDRARASQVHDGFGGELRVADHDVLAVGRLEHGGEQSHLLDDVRIFAYIDAVADIVGVLDEQEDDRTESLLRGASDEP